MSERWHDWLAQIELSEPIGALIVVGAGDGSDLNAVRASGAHRIILVEPNPAHLPGLERMAASDPRISVHAVAIGERDGRATFRLFNWAALSSLSAPDGLERLFPGLREVGTCDVRMLTLHSFLSAIDLPPRDNHVLRLDAPGIEPYVAGALRAGAARCHLVMRSARDPLYRGGRSASELRTVILAGDYRWCGIDTADADFTDQWLSFDPALEEMRTLRAELEGTQQQMRQFQQSHLLADADLRELRTRFERLKAGEPVARPTPAESDRPQAQADLPTKP